MLKNNNKPGGLSVRTAMRAGEVSQAVVNLKNKFYQAFPQCSPANMNMATTPGKYDDCNDKRVTNFMFPEWGQCGDRLNLCSQNVQDAGNDILKDWGCNWTDWWD